MSKERRGCVTPFCVTAAELDDRPIATPHHSLHTEAFEQMLDITAKRIDRPIGRRLGDKARELATDARMPRGFAQQCRPRFPSPIRDIRLSAMIDDNVEMRVVLK